MKVSGLYVRMLAAILIIQILAIMTMFFLVRVGKIRPPFARHAEERTIAIRDLVERELGGTKDITPEKARGINSLLHTFASAFSGKIWITSAQGQIVNKSFPDSITLKGDERIEHKALTPRGDTLYLIENRGHKNIYMTGPIRYGTNIFTIHVLHKWKKHREEAWFMEGLLVMATITALLLIPASRYFSRPIEKLTASAQRVAKGDFTPRVEAKGRSEVAVLANTFNKMTEGLGKMIRGSRELTANLSHELRSPLARIRISQQIIQERLESGRTDGTAKHLAKMEAEIDHMDGLIDKILALSKLDLQEPPVHADTESVNTLLETSAARQQPTGGRSFAMDLATPSPQVQCNRDDLMMVLDNVLTNALKYSPKNSTVTVASKTVDDHAEINVSNPYPALSPDELETVFVPFRRLGYDNVEGNGLGLAFARRIVEDHQGAMEASSENETFRMTIRLPLA